MALFPPLSPLTLFRPLPQCDEWAAMPKYAELTKPLGAPTAAGQQTAGLYTRSFGSGATVVVDLRTKAATACVVWADGSRSVSSSGAKCAADAGSDAGSSSSGSSSSGSTGSPPEKVGATVSIGSAVVFETLPEYLSVDLDWWHNTSHDCAPSQGRSCWGNAGALWLPLDHPRIRAAAAALSPGLLRIGGSLDKFVKYLVGGMTEAECHAPFGPVKGQVWPGLCLNMSRWAAIQSFAREAGLGLVFGLGYPDPEVWDSENALALLEYTSRSNLSLYGVELGEELSPRPGTPAFAHMVAAYSNLRKGVHSLPWPAQAEPPLVLGPCVGMDNEEGPGTAGFGFTSAFLKQTLTAGSLDAVVMHSYNNDGGYNWSQPGFLAQTMQQARVMLAETRKHSATAALWCGECGPHNAGGLANTTDTFLSSFWYADALAGLAKLGLSQFGRQALVGGNYGLLQEHTYEPNPDLYLAIVWKQLMGQEVLNATVAAAVGDVGGELHVYAHCEPARHAVQRAGAGRAVTLLFINVSPRTEYSLAVLGGGGGSRHEWHFSAPDVRSKVVSLNGKPLLMQGPGETELPLLPPKTVDARAPLTVAPNSLGFALLENVACPAKLPAKSDNEAASAGLMVDRATRALYL
jgi:heparanase 1